MLLTLTVSLNGLRVLRLQATGSKSGKCTVNARQCAAVIQTGLDSFAS